MTCHHPAFATGDGRSLSVGQAGNGVGPHRVPDASNTKQFIPRNSPPFFNLFGQRSFFHDGRVEQVGGNPNIRTPAGAQLTADMRNVFEFGPLSAVGLFPVMDRDEMRGNAGNELALLGDNDFTGVWSALMRRLGAIPEYRALFEAAYPGTSFNQMTFAHASNAIAGFLVSEFTFLRSPWDRFLEGEDRAVGEKELRGAQFFLTQGCASCHLGPALSNFGFHNTVLPQIGPGLGNGPSGRDDFGRMNVTGQQIDLYRFRTSALRNIELTAPYGHAGQFATLEGFVDHYNDVARAFRAYDLSQVEPALRGTLVPNEAQIVSVRDALVAGIRMSPRDVDDVSAFLRSLTDPAARNLGSRVPATVPSGLPVDRP
jgi:cytochrome c peroxidase